MYVSMHKETVVISVGGSLIVPNAIDTNFLKKLKAFVTAHTKKGFRFIIIAGGGATARNYQHAGHNVTAMTQKDQDWLGIHATRLNGQLLRSIFYKEAEPTIITHPDEKITSKAKIIIAAGWRPGWSTDYVAVRIAETVGAQKVINLLDVDYVYTKNPKKYKDAQPIHETSWKIFRNLLPKKWSPGLHSPFDPIAAREAEKCGMEVVIINGRKLTELQKYLSGKKFVGTRINS